MADKVKEISTSKAAHEALEQALASLVLQMGALLDGQTVKKCYLGADMYDRPEIRIVLENGKRFRLAVPYEGLTLHWTED